jgi:hypothetical protein
VENNKLKLWVKRILDTQQEEISCTECFNLVSVYVDEEIAGKASDQKWDPVRHHLDQCLACREEYEILSDLAGSRELGKEQKPK